MPTNTPTATDSGTAVEEDDHGNEFESATRIAIGEAVAVELEKLDDRDVLAFRARPGTEYVLTLDWETYQIWDNPGSILNLYDAFGRLLARLNDYDFSEQRLRNKIMWQAVTGGDYYIAIGDENTLGNYRIHRIRGGGNGTRSHTRSDRATHAARGLLRLRQRWKVSHLRVEERRLRRLLGQRLTTAGPRRPRGLSSPSAPGGTIHAG